MRALPRSRAPDYEKDFTVLETPPSLPNSLRTRPPKTGRVEPARVALADALPELADVMPATDIQASRRMARVRVLAVRRGDWDASSDAGHLGRGPGFVVIEGAILRRVAAGHRTAAELLGAGDVFRPLPGQDEVTWRVLADARVAILDHRALADAAATPEVAVALVTATERRATVVARQLAIAQWTSVDDRLLAIMQLLSDRWGVVTPAGIALPGFLSHATLAPLVGARRPSVTTALQRLTAAGGVQRLADGRWLLLPEASA